MPRSVRTRITLLSTSVTLGVCGLVCIALYAGLYITLHAEVDGFLEGEVGEFRTMLVTDGDADLAKAEQEIRSELGSRQKADLIFRLLDASGKLLITSDPKDRFANPFPLPPRAAGTTSEIWFDSVRDESLPRKYRICFERVQLPRTGSVVVQAAYRLDRVDRSLAICRMVCVCALILGAAVSIIGGRMVARRALEPVSAITQTAKDVNARKLSTRLPRSGSNDELDDLVDTLNEMLGRVEAGFTRIQQFTADAAHELRTPLTALRGNAELALGQARTAEQLRAVIEQSVDYYRILARVTDDLLLLARLDAGQEPLQREAMRLDQAIEDVVDLYVPIAKDMGVEITSTAAGDLTLSADDAKIRRLLSNLIDNAVKYMGGPGRVSVRAERSHGRVELVVSDTGAGIPRDDLPHVFERFYRADRARKAETHAESRSVGLGLAICRSIVQAHGGEITIESEVGRGTSVRCVMPINAG